MTAQATSVLRIGVIGAGIMGSDHAHTLRRSVRGAEVTAVADVDLARAQAAASTETERAPGPTTTPTR